MRLRRLPRVDEEQEAGADVAQRLLPAPWAPQARLPPAVEAEAGERTRRDRLPTPPLRHKAKRFGKQAARNATLPTCVAHPAASTWCETRW